MYLAKYCPFPLILIHFLCHFYAYFIPLLLFSNLKGATLQSYKYGNGVIYGAVTPSYI